MSHSLVGLLAAIVVGSAMAGDPAPADGNDSLDLTDTRFKACESEASRALIVARDAIWFKSKRDGMLGVPSNSDDMRAMINAIYDEVEQTGAKDHVGIAWRRFEACARASRLPMGNVSPSASQCLARQDLEFLAEADHVAGRPIDETRARIRNMLANAPASWYPGPMIDHVTSMVYMNREADGSSLIREALFESCLFPQAFMALEHRSPDTFTRFVSVIGTPTVGPDVRTRTACAAPPSRQPSSKQEFEVVVLVARDPSRFPFSPDLLRRAAEAGPQFADAAATAFCARGRSVRVVVDESKGVETRMKFAQQARINRSSLVVIVQTPVSAGFGKPGIDLAVTAVGLDKPGGDEVRGTYDRGWPVWSEDLGDGPQPPAALAQEFVDGVIDQLH
jgi:hypothetical protein